ncbi:MAG: hypothetical protein HY553_11415 [Elusimicrobia bacterium]|nr:hypothetical protein [Elusimicrobiota bacterium]
MTWTGLARAAQDSVKYLSSPQALESLRRDPYWPKWDSPWWHMALLCELGESSLIPVDTARALAASIRETWRPFFPRKTADVPPGDDAYRVIGCLCAAGTAMQMLHSCGLDPDAELPFARRMILDSRLPDGGVNCESDAYEGSRKSSVVSTVPALEAILYCTRRPFTQEEEAFLLGGAEYLLAHRLFRSTKGSMIKPEWTEPCFPRFYDYDVLRGLSFLSHLGAQRPLPWRERAAEALEIVERWAKGGFRVARPLPTPRSMEYRGGAWVRGTAAEFPLLKACRGGDGAREALAREWRQVTCAGRC